MNARRRIKRPRSVRDILRMLLRRWSGLSNDERASILDRLTDEHVAIRFARGAPLEYLRGQLAARSIDA
jgi:hypothetical protein